MFVIICLQKFTQNRKQKTNGKRFSKRANSSSSHCRLHSWTVWDLQHSSSFLSSLSWCLPHKLKNCVSVFLKLVRLYVFLCKTIKIELLAKEEKLTISLGCSESVHLFFCCCFSCQPVAISISKWCNCNISLVQLAVLHLQKNHHSASNAHPTHSFPVCCHSHVQGAEKNHKLVDR